MPTKSIGKAKRKVAVDLISQIDHLIVRWHLGFSEVERNLIRKALVAYIETKVRR